MNWGFKKLFAVCVCGWSVEMHQFAHPLWGCARNHFTTGFSVDLGHLLLEVYR